MLCSRGFRSSTQRAVGASHASLQEFSPELVGTCERYSAIAWQFIEGGTLASFLDSSDRYEDRLQATGELLARWQLAAPQALSGLTDRHQASR